ALERLPLEVKEYCKSANLDLDAWKAEIDEPRVLPEVFLADQHGTVNLQAFTPRGRKVLRLMQTEAQALGYDAVDLRHLLLALLAGEGGAMHFGLHQQGVTPRKVHEAVMLHLRARARKQPSSVSLARASMQPLLARLLEQARESALRDGAPAVGET